MWGLHRRKGPLACCSRCPPWVLSCRFTPSLRQLKQQALLLHVPPTLPIRLVQRLQEVSRDGGSFYPHLPVHVPSPLSILVLSCIELLGVVV